MEEQNNPLDQEEFNSDDLQDNLDESLAYANDEESGEESSEIARLKAEVAELKDKNLRLFAEFENFRKRTTKEKLDMLNNASQDILSSLLPTLDDFDRAVKAVDSLELKDPFAEGVLLVYNKFKGILKNKGLTELESDNQRYDPELHEAVTTIPAPTPELKDHVIDTLEKGYLLKDKLIRHAKVVVGA